MNLFGNRDKRFEDKLNKQLEGLEYKPSESLWDKIASDLPGDGFERAVAERMSTYQPKPGPEVWEQIERQLPLERAANKRRFLWLPALALLFSAGVYLGYELNKQDAPIAVNDQPVNAAHPDAATRAGSPTHANAPVNREAASSRPLQQPAEAIRIIAGKDKDAQHQKIVVSEPSDPIRSAARNHNDKRPLLNKTKANAAALNVTAPEQQAAHILTAGKQQAENEPAPVKKKQDIAEYQPATKADMKAGKNDIVPQVAGQHEEVAQGDQTLQPVTPATQAAEQREQANNPTLAATSPDQVNEKTPVHIPPVNDAAQAGADSSAPVTQHNDANKKQDENELTRFSINILTGMHYSFNVLSAPSGSSINFTDNIALRKRLETPALDWSGAFLLDYMVNKHWRISTGIMVSNFSQDFRYAVVTPEGTHQSESTQGAQVVNASDSIVNGSSYNNRIRYTWTEIPLFITYSLPRKGKLGIDLMGGISYAMINGVNAAYVSYDNVGVLVLTDKDRFPGIKNNFFLHFNPMVSYKLSEVVSLSAAPTFKYSLTSITANENWVQQHPYFIGLSVGLRRRF